MVVTDGDMVIDGPVPIEAPFAQPPAYHFQEAFVPNEPPITLSPVLWPKQIVAETAEAPVGFVDGFLTVTVTEAQLVVPQSPSALTKYVVVTVGFTGIVAPVPIEEPVPQPPIYHFHEAFVPNEPPETLIFVLPPRHIDD